MSTSTMKQSGEYIRFQFMFGFDETKFDKKNIKQENLTVNYVVPYHDDFSLSDLRRHVEHEHDDNIRSAYRTGNDNRRTERLGIAKASIESIREWFSCVDAEEFAKSLLVSLHTRASSWIDTNHGRLVLSVQTRRTYLD